MACPARILWIGVLAAASAAGAQVRYTVTDLGTLGGRSYATAINQNGDVVGWSEPRMEQGGESFLWRPGVGMVSLGALRYTGQSWATAINGPGRIVGYATMPSTMRGYRTAPFAPIDPDTDEIGSLGESIILRTIPDDINDAGYVVGWSQTDAMVARAFLYDGTEMISLGEASREAYAINQQGQICGDFIDDNGDYHAFLTRTPYGPCNPDTDDLGTLGGDRSNAYDLNEAARVVGASKIPQRDTHAFLYRYGSLRDLGTLGGPDSRAEAINRHDQVVGYADTSLLQTHAFLWERGQMFDLNDLVDSDGHWEFRRAYDVNDAGQIVGEGLLDGVMRAYLLTPIDPPIPLGDANGDRRVDIFDAFALNAAWNAPSGDPRFNRGADFNGDGLINVFDAYELNANWGYAAAPAVAAAAAVPEPACPAWLALAAPLLLRRRR